MYGGSLRSEAAQTFDLHIILVVVVVRTPHWREGGRRGVLSLCDVWERPLPLAFLSLLTKRALTLEVAP